MKKFESAIKEEPAVRGKNTAGGVGLSGVSEKGRGVEGRSTDGVGVVGNSVNYRGVQGRSTNEHGVFGESVKGYGVAGISEARGVHGRSTKGHGVWGTSTDGIGVVGRSDKNRGIYGKSTDKEGVFGESTHGIGIYGKGGRLAGYFEGDVEVTGDIRLKNADCAEDFNICADVIVEPGTVMVIGEEETLFPSTHAYDNRVAGVISGAGDYRPGIVLDKQKAQPDRQPIALLGKVYCKVDAVYGPIEVGDLLTTSDTPGHAMKAADPLKAIGAVIGKALHSLQEGQGLIPILITLQ